MVKFITYTPCNAPHANLLSRIDLTKKIKLRQVLLVFRSYANCTRQEKWYPWNIMQVQKEILLRGELKLLRGPSRSVLLPLHKIKESSLYDMFVILFYFGVFRSLTFFFSYSTTIIHIPKLPKRSTNQCDAIGTANEQLAMKKWFVISHTASKLTGVWHCPFSDIGSINNHNTIHSFWSADW